ncbi:MAG: cysteine desulfurase [Alphaproteobacteria bacterium]|nr:cysteine desulfurase [Alphaproteobacteria bacterium]
MSARFDVDTARKDFPILSKPVRGRRLVYLDSAGSAQKPRHVIDSVRDVYENDYANVHRGLHYLSERASARYEEARETVRAFINAPEQHEVVFTGGTTEAINLVAWSYGRSVLGPGDEVLITCAEHHSNIVPWHLVREQTGCVVKAVPVQDDGTFRLEDFARLITERTRVVSCFHVSNVLGTVLPLRDIARLAHAQGAVVVVDGAQGIVHLPVDVQELEVDFYAFSGHKLYGPSGIGVLWGRAELLEAMPPWQGGGGMIDTVTLSATTWADLPDKFEAGTPPIAQAIGLAAAIDYVSDIGIDAIARHEQEVLLYATQRLASVPGLSLVGTAAGKASVVSFVMDCAHPHDVSTIIDQYGVAVRAGHHCAQPLMDRFELSSTARASLALYNTTEDIDILVESLEKVREIFQ